MWFNLTHSAKIIRKKPNDALQFSYSEKCFVYNTTGLVMQIAKADIVLIKPGSLLLYALCHC